MLIGICGRARSGKDTAAEYLMRNHQFSRHRLADPIKAMLKAGLGIPLEIWEDNELKERQLPSLGRSPRYLAQTLGTEWGRELVHGELWLLIAAQVWSDAKKRDGRLVVPDVRFINEAEWVRSEGGRVFQIVRPEHDHQMDNAAHASEAGIPAALIDEVVYNDSTIEVFHQRLTKVLNGQKTSSSNP